MNLYEITKAYVAALDAVTVDMESGEVTGLDELEEMEGAFEAKTEATALYIKNLTALANDIRNEEKALAERRKETENKVESLKAYIARSMEAVEKDKLETAKVRLSFRSSTSVIAEDVDQIPEQFLIRVESVKPDKTALKNALKLGEVIPGARLETKRNLQIR